MSENFALLVSIRLTYCKTLSSRKSQRRLRKRNWRMGHVTCCHGRKLRFMPKDSN